MAWPSDRKNHNIWSNLKYHSFGIDDIMTLLPGSLLQNKSHTHGAISQRSVVATLWFGWVWFKIEGTFTKKSPCDNIHGVNIETRVFSDEGWGGVTTSENHRRREVCRIVDLKSNVENGLKKLLWMTQCVRVYGLRYTRTVFLWTWNF